MTDQLFERPWDIIARELAAALNQLDPSQFDAFREAFRVDRSRWFFFGQGRSGLIAEMAAMRFMQCGRDVHVIGETSAPAVREGDGLVLVSRSGQTPVTVAFARIGKDAGAALIAVTGDAVSELAQDADTRFILPTQESVQFGGSLFEQVSLLMFDALCLELSAGKEAHARMGQRHSNMQ